MTPQLLDTVQPLPTDPITYIADGMAIGNWQSDPTGFDAVATFSLTAPYAAPPTEEFRRPWPGNMIPDFLPDAVGFVSSHWERGERVLVRDYAGLNRCGLVCALTLVLLGDTVQDALNAVHVRSAYALCSPLYLKYLHASADA